MSKQKSHIGDPTKTKTYYHFQDKDGYHCITSTKDAGIYGKLLNQVEAYRVNEPISNNDKLEVGSVYSTTTGRTIKIVKID